MQALVNSRENYLRTVRFGRPQWIPVRIAVNAQVRIKYKDEIENIIGRFPEFFPNAKTATFDYADYGDGVNNHVETDAWGCVRRYSLHGIAPIVVGHPLADWENFEAFTIPDYNLLSDKGGARDWDAELKSINTTKNNDELTSGSLVHGFLFLRLQDLRGFENLMIDMADAEPRLFRLIEMIDQYNMGIVRKYCAAGVDIMHLPEDLGAENSMLISRDMFRRFISPSYRRMVEYCRDHGVLTSLHSDGYIVDIIDDLISIGFDVINPQDLCNGIDTLVSKLKGLVCIRLDIDRSRITPTGTRTEIFELIEQEVKKLGSKEGGLEFTYGCYLPTTPDRLSYVCEALKKYRTYWWDR